MKRSWWEEFGGEGDGKDKGGIDGRLNGEFLVDWKWKLRHKVLSTESSMQNQETDSS
jgi:hypothetical protein